MSTLPPDVWVPVSLRWRHVVAGDVVVGKDGALWAIFDVDCGTWFAISGERSHQRRPDPDEAAQVLVPAPERDALRIAREELGAQVIERRTAGEAA